VPTAPSSPLVPSGPTLAIDIGGTGLKASVLDEDDKMETARVRVPTTYPMPPARMVSTLTSLVAPLPAYQRVAVGFPGVVRGGKIVTAPHFVTRHGPGTRQDKGLVRAWTGFDLVRALSQALGKPVRVANDADLQGAAVIAGKGLELVVTLGTGVGTGLFWQGHLAPHLELAQHPLAKGETYNERLGEAARKKVGNKTWRKRVLNAIDILDTLINYDHLYLGGGNSGRLKGHVGEGVTIVDNDAGILGGIKLWEDDIL
jgi:polyphosphate glucokinase